MRRSSLAIHLVEMADYNRWANRRIYADAARLPAEALHRDVGVYFRSLFATLEHILKADRAWRHLLDGGMLADLPPIAEAPNFHELRASREAEDEAIIVSVRSADAAWLRSRFEFRSAIESWKDLTYRGTRAGVLAHLFNHQTHHRGQAHSSLLLLGAEPSSLDILVKGMLGE